MAVVDEASCIFIFPSADGRVELVNVLSMESVELASDFVDTKLLLDGNKVVIHDVKSNTLRRARNLLATRNYMDAENKQYVKLQDSSCEQYMNNK
eukprot:6963639-Lingulodinium_polyedra.AAC.1